ncbi:hypothetical protein TTHERM_00031630 (macronuclear) [Tetrahymena thermophila SB210]|uniref:Uncharacterized protein n=1 Tax=Tetrahymena thermophila (strain SB210) TaxID=312017 RepID=Q22MQ9_TETTS|nr:hypothetical protein TTHERM_00031630 [Tetrahymena thermophila SB210]EAR86613.1 hypothetical protein TTHERM_00031630 [Tetrahymena thermophila SB210]|eukprot:XP_976961.1 hypothetical protein TTHERM_00031630 [Tetrahymena thermophila SB210]
MDQQFQTKGNSLKISTLFTKINQHRLKGLQDNNLDIHKMNQKIDRQTIISQQLNKTDLLKFKLESFSEDKINSSFGILKQIKNINTQGRYQQNKQDSQNNIQQEVDQHNSLKAKQDSTKKLTLYEHQKIAIGPKQQSIQNDKQENYGNSKFIIKQESQKKFKTQQDLLQKNENVQGDQLVYSIDRGFSLKAFKNKFEFQKNRKPQNQNDRGLSLQNERPQLNKILQVKISQSPSGQQNIENQFKSVEQTKLAITQPKQCANNNNIFNKPQSLLSTIYFNQNPYQLNHKSSFLDSSKVSTKNSTQVQINVNGNDKQMLNQRISRKNLTDYHNQNYRDLSQQQENLSLYLLYREQQEEQDKKLRELSNQKSFRNSQVVLNKYSNKDLQDEEQEILESNISKRLHQASQSQKIKNQIVIYEHDKPIFKKKNLLNNTLCNSNTEEDQNGLSYCDFQIQNSRNKSVDQLKNQRSRSLQTIKINKNNKSIQIGEEQFLQDDFEDIKQQEKQSSLQRINKSIDENDDDDEEEEILYPSSQAKIQQKKTTQNATMQTTFTEQIPEIVARELDQINKNNQIQNTQNVNNNIIPIRKKERLISYLSVNHKNFLSSTSYYIQKYEYDQNNNQKFIRNLKNSKSQKQYDEQDKNYKLKNYSSTKCLTQDYREVNNCEQDFIQGQELIQMPITLHTSKEEFLSQLNKKIQKVQFYLNMIEKRKIQDFNNLQQKQAVGDFQNSTDEQTQTIQPQNYQIGKRLVFQIESEDVLKKIKESNNPQLYELLKSYQVNGCLFPIYNNRELEQISLCPLADQVQSQKTFNKFNNSKIKIICNIILKKQRNKTSHHYDINNILQQSSNAYKSQLLSQSLLNK